MAMKTSDSPRRLYLRAGLPLVCFEGRYFTASADSSVDVAHPVVCEAAKSDGGRARITVTQAVKGKATVTETWRSATVKRTPRQ